MTFQPPPPGDNPPPPPPPPPPPGQWGPPPGGAGRPGAFDPKSVNPLDWALLGVGLLVFIFSFVSFYSGGTVKCGGQSISVSGGSASAWHDVFGGGFFGWFAMLFAILGAVAVALELFMPQFKFAVANRLAALGLFALALLFEIIAIFVTPSDSAFGCSASVGHGAGFWISLILILAGTGLALMRAQQTGTALPGPLANLPNIGAKGPQGGIGGQQNPPPPPGYGPPPSQ
jgi:hypothetical protein